MGRMVDAIAERLLALVCRYRTGGVIINEHVLNRGQTREHVDALGRWFDFIQLEDLSHRISLSRRRRPFCLLTFDDGKRSNATEVAPELERIGVPAVFFVVSGAVGSNKPFWFDRFRALQKKLSVAPLGMNIHAAKQLPYKTLTEWLDHVCKLEGIEPDIRDDDVCPMNWDEVRNLHNRGFSIGAHGETHAILTVESRAAAFASIANSITKVSEEIGSPCPAFAFPNGNYTTEYGQFAVQCGANFVMTTEPTWVSERFEPWRLPRVQLFGFYSRGKMALKTALAATGLILPNPDGTGRAYVKANRLAQRTKGLQNIQNVERPGDQCTEPCIRQ